MVDTTLAHGYGWVVEEHALRMLEHDERHADAYPFETIRCYALPPEAQATLRLILASGPFPYPEYDGVRFKDPFGVLPAGDYFEYTVLTPSSTTRGNRRLVVRKQTGELFFSCEGVFFVVTDLTPRQRNAIADAVTPSREKTLERLLSRAEHVPLRLHGRAVALFFGLGSRANSKIPSHLATLYRLLDESAEGRLLLEGIEALATWSQQDEVWWLLSQRVSRLVRASGRKLHVYCNKNYLEAMFPSQAELQRWWSQYRETLSEPPDLWDADSIETQYYAAHRRQPQPGRYEDDIFMKIESLELPQALFHAIDESGRVLASWEIDYRTHAITNFRRTPVLPQT